MMASMADFGFKPPPPKKNNYGFQVPGTCLAFVAETFSSVPQTDGSVHCVSLQPLLGCGEIVEKIKFTFFSGGDFGLAPAVHAVQSFGAHAIAAAGEAGTLLGTAHAVVQVAETALAALSVLTTLVLRMLASVFCFSHSQHPLALLSFGSVRLG